MKNLVQWATRKGQSTIEYLIILALAVIVMLIMLGLIGPNLGNIYSNIVYGTPLPTVGPSRLDIGSYKSDTENGVVYVDPDGDGKYQELKLPSRPVFIYDVREGSSCWVNFTKKPVEIHLSPINRCPVATPPPE